MFASGIHYEIEYNNPALNNLYMIFADNSYTYEYLISKSRIVMILKGRKVFNIGYPRFDLIEEEINSDIHTILWLPRWSADKFNNISHFIDYFDKLMMFFTEHKNLNLIIRPHPLMFSNFISKGILSNDDVNNIKNKVKDMDNVKFDTNADYLITFKESDILVADFTTLIIEYFMTSKPIVLCDDNFCFNQAGKIMDDGLYHIDSWNELENVIEEVVNKGDKLYGYRKSVLKQFFNSDEKVGKIIADIIFKDAKR
jgi:CDP-glycerol glycerophosphotransferase (TagB/SpsB family)